MILYRIKLYYCYTYTTFLLSLGCNGNLLFLNNLCFSLTLTHQKESVILDIYTINEHIHEICRDLEIRNTLSMHGESFSTQ